MLPLEIEVSNYRCFPADSPLRLKLDRGFTAIVGPNNAGKSAVLKFFVEFGPLWQQLATPNPYEAGSFKIHISHVTDRREVFTTGTREIKIALKWPGLVPPSAPARVQITVAAPPAPGEPLQAVVSCEDLAGPPGPPPSTPVTVHKGFVGGREAQVNLARAFSVAKMLWGAVYLPAFRNAVNSGAGTHYGVEVGTAFVKAWSQWKVGDDTEKNEAIIRVTGDITRLLGFQSLDINASESGQTFKLVVDGRNRRLDEVGAGVAQSILLLGTTVIRNATMILVDEPELSLHAAKQADLLTALASRASEGVVLFATHSLGLARTLAPSVYTITRPTRDKSRIVQFESPFVAPEFIGEMNYLAQREVGVDVVLFVEGVTDVLPVRHFLRLAGKDAHVLVIPMGGKSDINAKHEYRWQDLDRLVPKVRALIDSEKESASAPLESARVAFCEMFSRLKYGCHVLSRRALENYFSEAAIKAMYPDARGLREYESLRSLSCSWTKSGNWRVAERMSWDDIKDTDLGQFIERLLD